MPPTYCQILSIFFAISLKSLSVEFRSLSDRLRLNIISKKWSKSHANTNVPTTVPIIPNMLIMFIILQGSSLFVFCQELESFIVIIINELMRLRAVKSGRILLLSLFSSKIQNR